MSETMTITVLPTTEDRKRYKGELIESLREASKRAALVSSLRGCGETSDYRTLAIALAKQADSICVMREVEGLAVGETCPVCGKVDC